MKKKLEADLMSIAHRILKLKSKDDIRQLHLEAQKLYEKLSILLFIEENFEEVKPTIGKIEVDEKVAHIFNLQDKEELVNNDNDVVSEFIEEQHLLIPEPIIIEEEKSVTEEIEHHNDVEILEEKETLTFPTDTFFEKVVTENTVAETNNHQNLKFVDIPKPAEFVFDKINAVNLNDKLKKSIDIGLNDKIAFEKNLFNGSTEDYNRVISQISTFDTLQEAQNFINNLVKPDYNNWKDQDEFANRFMEIVENKFS